MSLEIKCGNDNDNDSLAIVDNKMLHDMVVRMTWTVDISSFRDAITVPVGTGLRLYDKDSV